MALWLALWLALQVLMTDDMALWLALQVLMTDDMALADDAIQDRLILLQDRLEDKIRAWHGLADRNAGVPTREPA